MEKKIQLTPKKIESKEFKIDFKGYNADEVDLFLDVVMEDYERFASLLSKAFEEIDGYKNQIQELNEKIERLEMEKALQAKNIAVMEENANTNVDILKRLSLLEKAVFFNEK